MRKYSKPIGHHGCGGAPKIMKPPVGQAFDFVLFAAVIVCGTLPRFDNSLFKSRLRLRPAREATLAIAFAPRAITKNIIAARAARRSRDECQGEIGEWHDVLAVVFSSGGGDGPYAAIDFRPPHTADFVAT